MTSGRCRSVSRDLCALLRAIARPQTGSRAPRAASPRHSVEVGELREAARTGPPSLEKHAAANDLVAQIAWRSVRAKLLARGEQAEGRTQSLEEAVDARASARTISMRQAQGSSHGPSRGAPPRWAETPTTRVRGGWLTRLNVLRAEGKRCGSRSRSRSCRGARLYASSERPLSEPLALTRFCLHRPQARWAAAVHAAVVGGRGEREHCRSARSWRARRRVR